MQEIQYIKGQFIEDRNNAINIVIHIIRKINSRNSSGIDLNTSLSIIHNDQLLLFLLLLSSNVVIDGIEDIDDNATVDRTDYKIENLNKGHKIVFYAILKTCAKLLNILINSNNYCKFLLMEDRCIFMRPENIDNVDYDVDDDGNNEVVICDDENYLKLKDILQIDKKLTKFFLVALISTDLYLIWTVMVALSKCIYKTLSLSI